MRNQKKKLSLLVLFFGILISTQACQTQSKKETSIHDAARIQHAKQLLNTTYSKSVVAEFEKDSKLATYLERYIAQENSKLDAEEISQSLLQVSSQHFYDPVFLLAVVKTESQFNPSAIGLYGEIGLMQIKPDTAEWLCEKYGIEWKGPQALKDPTYNIELGAQYFKYLKKSLKDQKSANYINAYNMGLGNLHRMPAADRANHPYYGKVMENYIAIYKELKKIKNTI